MASTTLCFSGFAREETTQLEQLLEQVTSTLDYSWILASEPEASVMLIDMDSMYGHMSWLKAQGSGKITIGLTAGDRSETDFLLKRPLTVNTFRSLLVQIAEQPMQAAATPELQPLTTASAGPSAEYLVAVTTAKMAAVKATVEHEPRVSDFMSHGILGGPAKLQLPGAPLMAFDPVSQTYAGSTALKPLLPCVQAVLHGSDFTAIDTAEFERIKASSGGAQPYMRLLWLCGLTVGNGALLPGFDPGKKFHLGKWPQIEREFPKHFRLATVMMKGPALIREIAELSGASQSEAVDFINAGLLTGAVIADDSKALVADIKSAVALLAKPRAS